MKDFENPTCMKILAVQFKHLPIQFRKENVLFLFLTNPVCVHLKIKNNMNTAKKTLMTKDSSYL